jgi:hypothetical protein
MIAQYAGKCKECGGRFDAGDSIIYSKAQGARHTGCAPRGTREGANGAAARVPNPAAAPRSTNAGQVNPPHEGSPQPSAPAAGKVNGQGEGYPEIYERCLFASMRIWKKAVIYGQEIGLPLDPLTEDIRATATSLCIAETGGRR